MKIKKKWLCVALTASLMISAVGCSPKTAKKTEYEDGDMPETLSIFSPLGGSAQKAGAKSNNDLLAFKIMEERTGVHVEWDHPSTGAETEKFNLLLASGSLPDMICYPWRNVSGGVKMYADDDIIIPLSDLIDQYMPNLRGFNEKRPDIKKQYTSDEGEIFYIPVIRADKELKVYLGPQIRQDWLDKVGMEIPKTTDELYEVLKAFKTQDPNGNGRADEIPMTGVGFDNTQMGIGNLLWAFGVHYDFYVDDGEVKYGIMEDAFKDGLEYIVKLYSEGLIDADFLLNDRTKADAKMTNDQSGFIHSFQPTSYAINMDDGVRKVVGIPFLTATGEGVGKVFVPDYGNDAMERGIAVTTACQNPVGALKWLDEFFGGEGLEAMNFGREGESFNWVDDYPKLADELLDPKTGRDKMVLSLGMYETTFPSLQDWRYYEQILNDWGRDAIKTWADNSDVSGILPPLSFTEEENEEITLVMSQAKTFAQETMNKIAVGNEPIEYLDTARKKLKEMGIDRVLKIYNESYQRYMNR